MGMTFDPEAPANLGDIKAIKTHVSYEVKQLRELIMQLMQDKNPTKTPLPELIPDVDPSKVDIEGVASSEDDANPSESSDKQSKEKPKPSGESGKHNAVSPYYSPDPPIPHPHIVNQGHPPSLTPKSFGNWQYKIRSFLCSSSIELWRIVEQGFKAFNPNNLTRREVMDSQLNATSLYCWKYAQEAIIKLLLSYFSSDNVYLAC
jgi:hypothetical protein